tara:strand:- start:324 stop:608 length:285 start_codon:yes stop_codon:yes gene_type:complete
MTLPILERATELLNAIVKIQAIELDKGFKIEAVLESGEKIVLKEKSNKKPAAVQLYGHVVNHSVRGDGTLFSFTRAAPKTHSWGASHLKSFAVA